MNLKDYRFLAIRAIAGFVPPGVVITNTSISKWNTSLYPLPPSEIEIAQKVAEIKEKEAVTDQQMAGIEFEGVMCSATDADYDRLVKLYVGIKGGLIPKIVCTFENGSRLLLTKENYLKLAKVWAPFRMQFTETEL